jgi:hypothetical protein
MYINAVANSVMLYLQNDFYNIIFKTIKNLYIAPGPVPPPPPAQGKIVGACLSERVLLRLIRACDCPSSCHVLLRGLNYVG